MPPDLSTPIAKQGRQHVGINIANCARRQFIRRIDDFCACRNHTYPRLRHNFDAVCPYSQAGGNFDRPDNAPGRDHFFAPHHIFANPTHVLPANRNGGNFKLLPFLRNMFLHNHTVCASRQSIARIHHHCRCRLQ